MAHAAYVGLSDGAGDGAAVNSPFLGGVARYLHPPQRDPPGQARSSFALNGTSTVLFEVRGQQQSWGQKQRGMLTKAVEAGLMGIIQGMADGSVNDHTDEQWYAIPTYGWDQ